MKVSYDIIIATDETEKRIVQEDRGRRKEHSYEVWIESLVLSSLRKDFIVKTNNDRVLYRCCQISL